jgi:hypothetical protein
VRCLTDRASAAATFQLHTIRRSLHLKRRQLHALVRRHTRTGLQRGLSAKPRCEQHARAKPEPESSN